MAWLGEVLPAAEQAGRTPFAPRCVKDEVEERLRQRFAIDRVCIVADRGMISRESIERLESEGRDWQYILGARMRRQKEVSEAVLSHAGRYRVVPPKGVSRQDPAR